MNTFKINNQITFLLLYFAEKIQLKFKDLYVMPKNVRCLAPWTLIVVTTNIFLIMMKSNHFSVTTWRNVLQELYVEPNVLLKGIIILTISFSWVSTKKLKHWNYIIVILIKLRAKACCTTLQDRHLSKHPVTRDVLVRLCRNFSSKILCVLSQKRIIIIILFSLGITHKQSLQ